MTLDFDARLLVVALAAYGVVNAVLSAGVAASWRRLLPRAGGLAPSEVARRLLLARSLPAAMATAAAAACAASFGLYEPELQREEVGVPILILAGGGVVLLAASLVRGLLLVRASASLVSKVGVTVPVQIEGCAIAAQQVRSRFPLVALLGILRPRLIVSSQVLEVCTREELAAAVAHELAHRRAGDNLRLLLFAMSPDLLTWMPAGSALERAWRNVSELAADEEAAGGDSHRRLALASALVKVARVAVSSTAPQLPASALYRGGPIAERVERLLSPPRRVAGLPVAAISSRILVTAGMAATGVLLMAAAIALPQLHAVLEAAIHLGR